VFFFCFLQFSFADIYYRNFGWHALVEHVTTATCGAVDFIDTVYVAVQCIPFWDITLSRELNAVSWWPNLAQRSGPYFLPKVYLSIWMFTCNRSTTMQNVHENHMPHSLKKSTAN
jgi:hypothetical protein